MISDRLKLLAEIGAAMPETGKQIYYPYTKRGALNEIDMTLTSAFQGMYFKEEYRAHLIKIAAIAAAAIEQLDGKRQEGNEQQGQYSNHGGAFTNAGRPKC